MLRKGKIIYAFAAAGKTTLCNKYKNCLDLTSSEYQWLDYKKIKENKEKNKGFLKEKNPDWPNNYYKAIKESIKKYDYIFIAYPGIEYCKKNNLKYIRIFPTIDQKDDYIKRMINRGNNKKFIEKMFSKYDEFIKGCLNDQDAIKIIMKKGEYLEDTLKRVKITNNLKRK